MDGDLGRIEGCGLGPRGQGRMRGPAGPDPGRTMDADRSRRGLLGDLGLGAASIAAAAAAGRTPSRAGATDGADGGRVTMADDDAFCVIVTLDAKPEGVEPLLAMVGRNHDRMRLEPRFLNATIHVAEEDPQQIVLHETWRGRRNFDEVEMRRDYRQEYARRMPAMLRTPREMRYYAIVGSNFAFPGGLVGQGASAGRSTRGVTRVGDAFGLIVTLDVKPEFKEPMLAMMRLVHERMRLEPTFLNSTIHVAEDDPDRIVVHETWRDRRDFEQVQMRRDYRQERERSLPGMVRSPRAMRYYAIVRTDFAFPGN